MATTILVIGLFVFAAYLFKGIFSRTGIPDVLMLMLCGILIGPVMGWATPAQFGQAGSVLATMALVVILFEGGVDLDLHSLKPALSATLKLTLSTFIATVAIVTGVGMFMAGLDWMPALMLGMILGGTSSAVVIPLVQGLNVQGKARTVLILESAITDVLCIVGLFVLLDAAKHGGISAGSTVLSLAETMTIAFAIGAMAAFGWLFLLRAARRLPHGSFASAAMCFIVYGSTELLGFSGAIAALCFGLTLANGRRFAAATGLIRAGRLAAFSSREQGFLQELIFVLKTFFFVFLGISMQLNDMRLFVVGAVIVVAVYAVRHVLALFTTDRDTPHPHVSLTAIMVPKGLAAAVLAGQPLQQGISGGEVIQGIAYVVVLLSIGLTACMIPLQRVPPVSTLYQALFRGFAPQRDVDVPKP
ncbi:MAG: cation:proton antiporter [Nitrosomonadaceae bacterium]|jgi:cell volume regulation protein A|nr:cation:proton antiporter [Nitrosomonadaceae bacterium]